MPLLFFAATALSGDTLSIAHKLGEDRFANYTYGSDGSQKQVDGVQFVLAVVQEEVGPMSKAVKKAILIDHDWSSSETQRMAKKLCQTRGKTLPDPRMKGVVHALTELGDHGEEIPLAEIKPGDLVQYWMYSASQRNFFGHAGVVEKVQNGRIWLYGAHKSTNGIGVAPDGGLRLTAPLRAIYAVRLK